MLNPDCPISTGDRIWIADEEGPFSAAFHACIGASVVWLDRDGEPRITNRVECFLNEHYARQRSAALRQLAALAHTEIADRHIAASRAIVAAGEAPVEASR
jgi:hypothetical protein